MLFSLQLRRISYSYTTVGVKCCVAIVKSRPDFGEEIVTAKVWRGYKTEKSQVYRVNRRQCNNLGFIIKTSIIR